MPVPVRDIQIEETHISPRSKNQQKVIKLLSNDPTMAYTIKEIQTVCGIHWPAAAHTAVKALVEKGDVEEFRYKNVIHVHWIGEGSERIIVRERQEYVGETLGAPDGADLQTEKKSDEDEFDEDVMMDKERKAWWLSHESEEEKKERERMENEFHDED